MNLLDSFTKRRSALVYSGIIGFSLLFRIFSLRSESMMPDTICLFLLCGLWLLVFWLSKRPLQPRFDMVPFLAALITALSILLHYSLRKYSIVLGCGISLVALLAFYCLYYSFSCFDFSVFRDSIRAGSRMSISRRLTVAVVFIVILLVQYSFYYPYGISGDTVNQWQQIHGILSYNTIHAIGHTVFLKLLLSVWDSYTFVILVQLAAIVFLYSAFAEFFFSRGFSLPFITFVLALGLIWTPAATDAWFYPVKDTPATLCLCGVTLLLARYIETKQISSGTAFCLGLLLAGCYVFRLNGIVTLLICGAAFVVIFIKKRFIMQLFAFSLSIFLLIGGVRLYSEQVLHPKSLPNGFSIQIFASSIAAAVHEDDLSPEEIERLEGLVPIDWMREKYTDPLFKLGLFWDGDDSPVIAEDPDLAVLNNEFVLHLGENRFQIVKLFLQMLPKHFSAMAKDIIGSIAIIWGPHSFLFVSSHVFWAAGLGCFAIRKGLRKEEWLIFLPCLCNTVSIMISTVTNEWRYLLPVFMLAPFFFLFILWRTTEREAVE